MSDDEVCVGAYLGGCRLPRVQPVTYSFAVVVVFLATVVAIVGRFATAVVAEVLRVEVSVPCILVAVDRQMRGCWAPRTFMNRSCTCAVCQCPVRR